MQGVLEKRIHDKTIYIKLANVQYSILTMNDKHLKGKFKDTRRHKVMQWFASDMPLWRIKNEVTHKT